MRTLIVATAAEAARKAAAEIAACARREIALHGRFLMALSGGQTPVAMFRSLAREKLPWEAVRIFQTDERVAPRGSAERNLTLIESIFVRGGPLPPNRLYPMPVGGASLAQAAQDYAHELRAAAGKPVVLDLVHLGLGTDGHTASLLPDDPVLDVTDADVAVTGRREGFERMTLTLPLLNRASRLVFLVTGGDKAEVLAGFLKGNSDIPATRLRRSRITVIADSAAAAAPPRARKTRARPAKAGPRKARPAKARPRKVSPRKVSPRKVSPRKTRPGKARPAKARPRKARPRKAHPGKARPRKARSRKARPGRRRRR